MINCTLIKFLGIIEEDDFKRIYNLKKQTQSKIYSKIQELNESIYYKNTNNIIGNIISKFETKFEITTNQKFKKKLIQYPKSESVQNFKLYPKLESAQKLKLYPKMESTQKLKPYPKSESAQKSRTQIKLENEITKQYLMYFISRIEIDSSKKIYIYLNF